MSRADATPWTWFAQELGQGLSFGTAWPGEIKEQEEKASQSVCWEPEDTVCNTDRSTVVSCLFPSMSHDIPVGMCFLRSGFGKRMDKEALLKSPSSWNLPLGEKHLLCLALLDQHLDICENGYYSLRRKTSLGHLNIVWVKSVILNQADSGLQIPWCSLWVSCREVHGRTNLAVNGKISKTIDTNLRVNVDLESIQISWIFFPQ